MRRGTGDCTAAIWGGEIASAVAALTHGRSRGVEARERTNAMAAGAAKSCCETTTALLAAAARRRYDAGQLRLCWWQGSAGAELEWSQ